jgi:hypothetical protein
MFFSGTMVARSIGKAECRKEKPGNRIGLTVNGGGSMYEPIDSA